MKKATVRKILHKKNGVKNSLYYEVTKSNVQYVVDKKCVSITHIKSNRTGDAHSLMVELYDKFTSKIFKADVIISPERQRALNFWKSEGFKIVNKVEHPGMKFYEMEKKENGEKTITAKRDGRKA